MSKVLHGWSAKLPALQKYVNTIAIEDDHVGDVTGLTLGPGTHTIKFGELLQDYPGIVRIEIGADGVVDQTDNLTKAQVQLSAAAGGIASGTYVETMDSSVYTVVVSSSIFTAIENNTDAVVAASASLSTDADLCLVVGRKDGTHDDDANDAPWLAKLVNRLGGTKTITVEVDSKMY